MVRLVAFVVVPDMTHPGAQRSQRQLRRLVLMCTVVLQLKVLHRDRRRKVPTVDRILLGPPYYVAAVFAC